MGDLHSDELDLDAALVRRLVDASLPELHGAPVEPLNASGSTNALFRIGTDLLARFPRQPGGSGSIEKEARWLPYLAGDLSTPTPEVVALGEPGFGYGERWLVTRWIDGDLPQVPWRGEGPSGHLAHGLARFVAELGQAPVPSSARDLTWYRGGPLANLADDFDRLVEQCRAIPGLGLDLDHARRVWQEALLAERSRDRATTWVHGDLLAENVLVRDGRLAAVLDFGGLSVGDPTVDLIAGWELLDADGRRAFREALGADDATWQASKGWALLIALMTFPYYWVSMPRRCADRRAMAAAVLAET